MASESGLKFVSKFVICPPDSELNGLIEEMNQCNSDSGHKNLIDKILTKYIAEYGGPNGNYIRNILIEFFIRTGNRKNLRKYMYEKLNLPTIQDTILFEYIVNSLTNEIQENINNLNIFRIRQCYRILCFLSAFIENLKTKVKYVYLLETTFSFYLCILEVCTSQLFNSSFCRDGCEERGILEYEDCYTVLHMALEQLSQTLPKAEFVKSLIRYSVKMVIMTHEILQCNTKLRFDTIMKCAIVFSYFSVCLPREERVLLKHQDHPTLDFIDNPESNYCMILKTKKLSNLFDTETMKVFLNLTVYYSVDQDKLYQIQISGKPLLEYLYLNLIDLGIKKTICPDHATPITRTLNAIAEYVGKLQNFDEIFANGMEFAWIHLDHFVEQVVISTKSFLGFLVKEAMRRYDEGEKHHIEKFLYVLNTQQVFGKMRLNALLSTCEIIPTNLLLISCPQIQSQLLTVAGTSPDRELAGQIYMNLMTSHFDTEVSEDDIIRIWLRPVLITLKNPTVKYHSVLQKIIIYAFQIKSTIFRKLFSPRTASPSETECIVILKCVHFARMRGIELPVEGAENKDNYWRNLILKAKLDLYMIHQDDEVRLSVLQVVVDCQKTSEEFTEWELIFLIKYFEYNVAPQLTSTRNKIFNFYKKVLIRYQSTHTNIVKKMTAVQKVAESAAETDLERERQKEANEELKQYLYILEYYNNFLPHLLQLLILYLSPDANFSRKSICLELLLFIQAYIDESDWQFLFAQDEIKNLKRILHDNYECNKAMAVALLRTLSSEAVGFKDEPSACLFFHTCLEMACDIRPSKSLTASYMFQLLFISKPSFGIRETRPLELVNKNQCLVLVGITKKLENMFLENKGNVIEAAKSTPFYGLLLSCRNLLQNRDVRDDNKTFSLLFRKLADLCLQMQEHIMPVVCNPSPEGYLPDGEDADYSFEDSDQSSKAQQIMVYSWKTMKEIMLLLAELANQTVTLENICLMLPQDYLLKIGEFFMGVFIKSKHRGVFEQAHAAFTTICRSFAHSKYETLNNLPVKWLDEGVAYCTGRNVHPELSSTRRSAGLPFLILSIVPVLAEIKADHVRGTLDPLLTQAHGQNEELRIHSLNVLRFIFKSSKLSEHTKTFIGRGTIAALEGYRSRIWGVRNSSTLLLSTLIIRIFGVPNKTSSDPNPEETRLPMAVFYMRYQQLFHFLLKTLKEECGKSDSLILHPVLVILSRLNPSHDETINKKVKEHIPFINVCIKNPSFPTRELAAKASISLIGEHFYKEQLDNNFTRIGCENLKDTECHGLLLQVCHILQFTTVNEGQVTEYLKQSLYLLHQTNKNRSHLTITLYMDIVFIMLTKCRNYKNLSVLKNIVCSLCDQPAKNQITTCQTSFAYSRFQLLVYILLNSFQHVAQTYEIVNSTILTYLYSDDAEMKKKCLHFLIYLNQEYSADRFKEQPIVTAGDLEICSQIKTLIHSLDFKSKKELLTYTHPHLISYFRLELLTLKSRKKYDLFLDFMLLRFYPCFFSSQKRSKQEVLNWLLDLPSVFSEELASTIISCVKTFITTLGISDLRELDFTGLVKLLIDSSSPNAADFRRLTVAQFLVSTQVLFKHKIFTEFDRYNVLNVIMVLLEDDEPLVRNTMSQFPTKHNKVTVSLWNVIPHKARATLLVTSISDFRNDVGVCCLASWALRRLPEVSKDASEVYERGELNTFSENIPITEAASSVLHAVLWKLSKSLSYEDKSIFLEEQTLLVTTIVLDSLIKIPSPMMDKETKYAVISVFKCIYKFIEECTIGNDFRNNFTTFFNSRVLKFLRDKLDTDYSSAKAFLIYLYNPLLNARFRFPE